MTEKITDLNKELKKYFGFDQFRGGQEEIIRSILEGDDTLIVMPTGGGKSLCYQLPALVMPGTAIVISPLIALMKDQVDALQRAGNPAAFINSSMSYSDINSKFAEIREGKYKLVYIAPERLESNLFSELLKIVDISFLAVDEAHCISEWGHDFRPSYMKIPQALKDAGDFPVAALTATATPEVRDDIIKSLEMENVNSFVRGFDRPNLSYNIVHSEDKLSDLVSICKNIEKGSVIVYCGTRKRVEWFAKGLKDNGLRAGYYHAGMEPQQRQFVQESFISGKTSIICATNAFGMGIDKPDVRAVVHCDLPMTLEAYYQEAGRAGRDGLESVCTVLYSPADRSLQEFFLDSNFPEKELVIDVYNYLYDIHNAKTGFKPHNPVFLNEVELANRLGEPYFKIRSAINLLLRNEIITTGRSSSKARIMFTTSREAIREFYKNTSKDRRETLEAVLRSCSSEVFREETEFDLLAMCRKFDIAPASAKKSLQALEYTGLLKYTPEAANGGIIFLKERYSSDRIPVDFKAFEKRRQFACRKVDIMHTYAKTSGCKRNFILGYFGETDISDTCGKCSSCKSKKPGSGNGLSISQLLLEGIAELDRDFTPRQIVDFLRGEKSKTVESFGLDEAEYFGALSGVNPLDITGQVEVALESGLLRRTGNKFGSVELTEAGYEAIDNIPDPFDDEKNMPDFDEELMDTLNRLVEAAARREGVSPRSIIDLNTLKKIVRKKPSNIDELSAVNGVSPHFVLAYGDLILNAVNPDMQYMDNNVLPEHKIIAGKISEGVELQKIAREMKISLSAAGKLAAEAIESGVPIDISKICDEELIRDVNEIIAVKPRAALRHIRSEIPGADVNILRIAIAAARRELGR